VPRPATVLLAGGANEGWEALGVGSPGCYRRHNGQQVETIKHEAGSWRERGVGWGTLGVFRFVLAAETPWCLGTRASGRLSAQRTLSKCYRVCAYLALQFTNEELVQGLSGLVTVADILESLRRVLAAHVEQNLLTTAVSRRAHSISPSVIPCSYYARGVCDGWQASLSGHGPTSKSERGGFWLDCG
jgi:hypothetical protein